MYEAPVQMVAWQGNTGPPVVVRRADHRKRTLVTMLRYILSFAAVASLVACGSADPTVSVTASPSTISSGDVVTLTVDVTDFELRKPGGGHNHQELRAAEDEGHEHHGGTNSADGGHFHVYLNTLDTNPLLMGWSKTTTVAVTGPAGPHVLIVRLNSDDHAFLVPQIKAEANITIQ